MRRYLAKFLALRVVYFQKLFLLSKTLTDDTKCFVVNEVQFHVTGLQSNSKLLFMTFILTQHQRPNEKNQEASLCMRVSCFNSVKAQTEGGPGLFQREKN